MSEINESEIMKKKIKKVLDEKVAPMLRMDGGGVELIDFTDGIVKVKLTGACGGCPMAQMTLQNGVERILKTDIPEIKKVEAELI